MFKIVHVLKKGPAKVVFESDSINLIKQELAKLQAKYPKREYAVV